MLDGGHREESSFHYGEANGLACFAIVATARDDNHHTKKYSSHHYSFGDRVSLHLAPFVGSASLFV
jgi:hypothetical protein